MICMRLLCVAKKTIVSTVNLSYGQNIYLPLPHCSVVIPISQTKLHHGFNPSSKHFPDFQSAFSASAVELRSCHQKICPLGCGKGHCAEGLCVCPAGFQGQTCQDAGEVARVRSWKIPRKLKQTLYPLKPSGYLTSTYFWSAIFGLGLLSRMMGWI